MRLISSCDGLNVTVARLWVCGHGGKDVGSVPSLAWQHQLSITWQKHQRRPIPCLSTDIILIMRNGRRRPRTASLRLRAQRAHCCVHLLWCGQWPQLYRCTFISPFCSGPGWCMMGFFSSLFPTARQQGLKLYCWWSIFGKDFQIIISNTFSLTFCINTCICSRVEPLHRLLNLWLEYTTQFGWLIFLKASVYVTVTMNGCCSFFPSRVFLCFPFFFFMVPALWETCSLCGSLSSLSVSVRPSLTFTSPPHLFTLNHRSRQLDAGQRGGGGWGLLAVRYFGLSWIIVCSIIAHCSLINEHFLFQGFGCRKGLSYIMYIQSFCF